LDVETIQVSLAHAYPGTELYDYAKKNGFIVGTERMVDEGGHQLAQIEYPGLPREHVLEMVHKFYDEYYFRPKAIYRVLKEAAFVSASASIKREIIPKGTFHEEKTRRTFKPEAFF